MRGIVWPTEGSNGGFASSNDSIWRRRELSDWSPPATDETHITLSCTRSVRFLTSRALWWRSTPFLIQSICLSAACAKASCERSLASSGTSWSQCVSTNCTTASGAPVVR